MTAVFAVVTASVLLAHEGGWDEALLIGAPILIIMGLLWLAKRRVDGAHETAQGPSPETTPGAGSNVTGSNTNRPI